MILAIIAMLAYFWLLTMLFRNLISVTVPFIPAWPPPSAPILRDAVPAVWRERKRQVPCQRRAGWRPRPERELLEWMEIVEETNKT